jgi:hypothetical protein
MLRRLRTGVLHRLQLRESWVIFFVLGIILLNFPFLQIFNKPATIFGFPLMFMYLFTGWMISIFIIYLFTLAIGNIGTKASETHKP